MYPIITISREFGSGFRIFRRLLCRLGHCALRSIHPNGSPKRVRHSNASGIILEFTAVRNPLQDSPCQTLEKLLTGDRSYSIFVRERAAANAPAPLRASC